jgi:hypothetical protein
MCRIHPVSDHLHSRPPQLFLDQRRVGPVVIEQEDAKRSAHVELHASPEFEFLSFATFSGILALGFLRYALSWSGRTCSASIMRWTRR